MLSSPLEKNTATSYSPYHPLHHAQERNPYDYHNCPPLLNIMNCYQSPCKKKSKKVSLITSGDFTRTVGGREVEKQRDWRWIWWCKICCLIKRTKDTFQWIQLYCERTCNCGIMAALRTLPTLVHSVLHLPSLFLLCGWNIFNLLNYM